MEQHPIPIKKPVSNKQPSFISSTRKIKKSKRTHKYAVRTVFCCFRHKNSYGSRCCSRQFQDHFASSLLWYCNEGLTGVFSWCAIHWFYSSWNVNLRNYSAWSVNWRFFVTCEELQLLINWYTWLHTLFYVILIRVVYREWFRYAICNMEPSLASVYVFAFLKHSSLRAGYLKEYLTCLFSWFGKMKSILISVIRDSLLFFRSWTVPETYRS